MVFARHAFADGRLHEAGEGGEDVDGGVDAAVVELAVDEDLAFGDVASEIGDGVGDVCGVLGSLGGGGGGERGRGRTVVGHSQDRDLGDGAVAAFDTAGTLVDGG